MQTNTAGCLSTDSAACEDNITIKEVLAGEGRSFKRIVDKYQGPLYDLAWRMTGNAQDAQDIMQDSLIKMYSKLSSYDGERPFRNWAYTITLNETRNHLRRKALLRFLPFHGEDEDGQPQEMDFADNAQNTENAVALRELLRDLEKNLLKLPQDLRAAFILYHLHNLTVDDIAAQCGVSSNAVHVRLSRARASLYEIMPALRANLN